MNNELQGKLIHVGDIQTFESGFTKRVFAIETDDKYPQKVPFELFKDSVDLIESYNIGDIVKVQFNIRGNEYNGKYYCSLNAWRIENVAPFQEPAQNAEEYQEVPNNIDDDSDLPF